MSLCQGSEGRKDRRCVCANWKAPPRFLGQRDMGWHQARSNWDWVSSGARPHCWDSITGSTGLETGSLAASLLAFLVSPPTVTGPRYAQRPSAVTAGPHRSGPGRRAGSSVAPWPEREPCRMSVYPGRRGSCSVGLAVSPGILRDGKPVDQRTL